jgi:hypothetical protein
MYMDTELGVNSQGSRDPPGLQGYFSLTDPSLPLLEVWKRPYDCRGSHVALKSEVTPKSWDCGVRQASAFQNKAVFPQHCYGALPTAKGTSQQAEDSHLPLLHPKPRAMTPRGSQQMACGGSML